MNTPLEPGKTIVKASSQNPAMTKYLYKFKNDIFFESTKSEKLVTGHKNETSQHLTFGLTQGIEFNQNTFEANSINTLYLFKEQTATFSSLENVTVYLASGQSNGMVISQIRMSEAIDLKFKDSPVQCIKYENGHFVKICKLDIH